MLLMMRDSCGVSYWLEKKGTGFMSERDSDDGATD